MEWYRNAAADDFADATVRLDALQQQGDPRQGVSRPHCCEHLGDGVRVRGLVEADNNLAPAIDSYPAKRHRASRPTYVPVNFCGNQNLGPEFSGTDPGKSERPGHSVAE